MCFYTKQSKSAKELKQRFNARFDDELRYIPQDYINGFAHPYMPVITNKDTSAIQLFNWGLLPSWAKDRTIQNNTLNARLETIQEKPSFRSYVSKRCLVLANGFYEWQWLDEKGKKKQKYELSVGEDELFSFGGLWNEWVDKETGEVIPTFTILTTEANEQMARIHNSKKRMPLILTADTEMDWLNGKEVTIGAVLTEVLV